MRSNNYRRSSPLPFVLVLLALLIFAAGLGTGWISASILHDSADHTQPPSADPTLPTADLTPTPSADVPPTLQPTVPPSDEPSSSPPPDRNVWNLILVNSKNPLPENFTDPDLTQLRYRQAVDSRAYPELQEMMDAARAEGLQPLICSSYRDWDTQTQLFEAEIQNWLNRGFAQEEAEAQAAVWVARPGTSEHQTGLTVDIVDMSYQLLDVTQEKTPVQQWLMAHCVEYGFILRYPANKSDITGIGYEPWHYRYVGVEAAREITERGLCLEEYLLGG